MSKVAINGRTFPLIPIAAGLAGVVALGAFMVMPQAVLEALVWQTRLDTVLPAAQPPLGGTARLLVAIAAAAIAAGLTALFAWKFAALGTAQKPRRRRRRGTPQLEEVAIPVAAPAMAELATPAVAEAEEKQAKPSFLDRLRRKKVEQEDEIDLDAMPNLRRRDFHPDAPARRPLFADAELPGKTLDSAEPVMDMPVSASPTPSPFGSTPATKFPSWAYEEDCDLSGQGGRTAPNPETLVFESAPPVEPIAPEPVAVEAEAEIAPASNHAPGSAGTADWDDPSAFDQYMELQAEEARERALEDELQSTADSDEAQPDAEAPAVPDRFAAPVAPPMSAPVAPSEPLILAPAAEKPTAGPAPIVADEALTVSQPEPSTPQPAPAGWLETELANTEIGSESVDALMTRLEAGMARRAARRDALQAQAARKAELRGVAAAPQQQLLDPIAPAPAPTAPSSNPFAAIDPLANLADKEAEVDEALRAALNTLDRMNRRAG